MGTEFYQMPFRCLFRLRYLFLFTLLSLGYHSNSFSDVELFQNSHEILGNDPQYFMQIAGIFFVFLCKMALQFSLFILSFPVLVSELDVFPYFLKNKSLHTVKLNFIA